MLYIYIYIYILLRAGLKAARVTLISVPLIQLLPVQRCHRETAAEPGGILGMRFVSIST